MKKLSLFGIPLSGAAIRILVGCVLIFFPAMAVQAFGYIVGALLLVYGLILVINGSLKGLRMTVATGAVLLILGGVAFFFTDPLFSLLLCLLGAFVLIRGVLHGKMAWDMKQAGDKAWRIHFVLALVLVIVALLSFFAPGTIKNVVVIILGVSLLLDGVEAVCVHFRGQKILRQKHTDDGRIYVDSEDAE